VGQEGDTLTQGAPAVFGASLASRRSALGRLAALACAGPPTMTALVAGAGAGRAAALSDVEVPFITTPDHVTVAMLEIAGVKPGDHVIDLGSGDGRIVITAARRFGATGLGVDIVPDLVERSIAHAERAGVADRVRFRVQDLFDPVLDADLARATVVTMYLLPEVNLRLRPRLQGLKKGTRIVSHDWDMGDWPPLRQITLPVPDKAVGREKLSRVYLWVV
jgi:SAM-dependent methyltransferase